MINRRQVLHLSAALLATPASGLMAQAPRRHRVTVKLPIARAIPSTGEWLPVIGMGTSRSFDKKVDAATLTQLANVMQEFILGGGSVIDSSPMYGEAENRVGDVLRAMTHRPKMFTATKVWTDGEEKGIAQMQTSSERMGVEQFSLIAVHNLRDWQAQLKTLQRWKDEEKVRYIGITTSHGRDHQALLEIMRREPLDFVQFSYNIEDRAAEQALLPLAQERGIATMINRPFQRGSLFKRTRGEPLPALAQELDCSSWAQFFLKFILAHPGVTCIIPASANAEHMADNMQAGVGQVPNARQQQQMQKLFESI